MGAKPKPSLGNYYHTATGKVQKPKFTASAVTTVMSGFDLQNPSLVLSPEALITKGWTKDASGQWRDPQGRERTLSESTMGGTKKVQETAWKAEKDRVAAEGVLKSQEDSFAREQAKAVLTTDQQKDIQKKQKLDANAEYTTILAKHEKLGGLKFNEGRTALYEDPSSPKNKYLEEDLNEFKKKWGAVMYESILTGTMVPAVAEQKAPKDVKLPKYTDHGNVYNAVVNSAAYQQQQADKEAAALYKKAQSL